jgi:hypothetical protein
MELDYETKLCVECPVGKYKNVSANDTNMAAYDRFWCKECATNLTTYTIQSKEIGNCIGNSCFSI